MKVLRLEGKFAEVPFLHEEKKRLVPGETWIIQVPTRVHHGEVSPIRKVAYESLLFAVSLLEREARESGGFSVRVEYV